MSTLGEILRGGGRLQEHIVAGQQLLLAQNPAGALKHAMAALALAPDNGQALILAAACNFDLGRFDETREIAKAALKVAPESFIVHRVISMIHLRDRQLDLAELHVRKAIELSPTDPLSHACLINVLIAEARRFGEAATAADEALKLGIDSPSLLSSCAIAYCNVGRLKEAEALALRVFAIAPEHPSTLTALGQIVLRSGDSDAALDLAQRAMIAAPRNPGVLQLYARVQMSRSRLLAPLWRAVVGLSYLPASVRVVIYFCLLAATTISFVALPSPCNIVAGSTLLAITVLYVACAPLALLIIQRLAARAAKPAVLRRGF